MVNSITKDDERRFDKFVSRLTTDRSLIFCARREVLEQAYERDVAMLWAEVKRLRSKYEADTDIVPGS